jgi:hypothetical protein
MAHQIPLDHEDEPLEVRYLRWLVVTQVTPWLLRGLLLLATDIEPGVLREGHSENSRFFHFARQSDHTWCRTREKVCCRARRSTKR